MDIPFAVQKCVAFVGYKRVGGTEKFAGSAFFLHRSTNGLAFTYIATAAHVVQGIKDKGLEKVLLRLNYKTGQAKWIDSAVKDWYFHPDPAVDVAVARFPWMAEIDHVVFPLAACLNDSIIREESIGAGNEVFLSGLFHLHSGERNNLPIVRIGNIAAMPNEKIDTPRGPVAAYLIEVRSIGGLSGSPVFITFGLTRSVAGLPLGTAKFFLLGVMHGHFDTTESDLVDEVLSDSAAPPKSVNMGIAVVTPAEKILEVIQQSQIGQIDTEVERDYRSRL